jgi:hypothetical protein
MNELIKEYLQLVERTVKTNDVFAYQRIEQIEAENPEIIDAVYQAAGPLSYDFYNRIVYKLVEEV